VDFVVLPPGHGSSVTDFQGWDAHEAQIRCADDMTGERGRCSSRLPEVDVNTSKNMGVLYDIDIIFRILCICWYE